MYRFIGIVLCCLAGAAVAQNTNFTVDPLLGITLNQTTAPAPAPEPNMLMTMVGKPGSYVGEAFHAFGTGAYPTWLGSRAMGTNEVRLPLDLAGRIFWWGDGYGYNGSSYIEGGNIGLSTSEPWTATANGSQFTVGLTARGTTVASRNAYQVTGEGRLALRHSAGTLPTVSACGTSPGAVSGNDASGQVTEGAGATGCKITFTTNAPFSAVPRCTANLSSATPVGVTATVIDVTFSHAALSGAVLTWLCMGT